MDFEHIVIYKGTDYHSAFPHVIRLKNGDLVVVFRQARTRPGSGEAGTHNEKVTHSHIDSGSRIALVRSTDDGKTWDPGSLVVIDASDGTEDLNMAMISELSSGELIVNNHRWFVDRTEEQAAAVEAERLVHSRPGERGPRAVVFDSLFFMRSSDQGRTWDQPKPVGFSSLVYRSHTGKSGFTVMPDGSLLLPLNGYSSGDETDRVYVVRSNDEGHTWTHPSTVLNDPEQRIGFGEPPMLRLSSGKLLIVARTRVGEGYLYQAHSDDDGWVWQGLKRTPIWGFPCHLLQLRSGRVLCAYGYRREPFGIRAVISEDEGETWDMDREIVIRDDGLHRDLGYPASIQLNDGRIMTIYYYHGEDGIRYIGGSIYSEQDALG